MNRQSSVFQNFLIPSQVFLQPAVLFLKGLPAIPLSVVNPKRGKHLAQFSVLFLKSCLVTDAMILSPHSRSQVSMHTLTTGPKKTPDSFVAHAHVIRVASDCLFF